MDLGLWVIGKQICNERVKSQHFKGDWEWPERQGGKPGGITEDRRSRKSNYANGRSALLSTPGDLEDVKMLVRKGEWREAVDKWLLRR